MSDESLPPGARFGTPMSPYQRPPATERWQRVLNESWPLRDRNGQEHARGIPEQPGIEVVARIVWEHDGEQRVHGRATRWTRTHVCVQIGDERLQVPYVWLRASDVTRAKP